MADINSPIRFPVKSYEFSHYFNGWFMANTMVGKSDIVPGKADDEEKRWRAESDMRTLMSAEEVKADKARHAEAKKMAKAKMDSMKKIAE